MTDNGKNMQPAMQVWKCYAESTETAIEVIAPAGTDPAPIAGKALHRHASDVVCRYVINRSGVHVVAGVRPWPKRTKPTP